MITAKIVTDPFEAQIGNDFKIIAKTITDSEGNSLNLDTSFFEIEWKDTGGIAYFIRHDPNGENLNCKVEDGVLQMIFDRTKYRFRYPELLSYRIHTRSYDSDMFDGAFDIWTVSQKSNIRLTVGGSLFGCKTTLSSMEMPFNYQKGDKGDKGDQGEKGDSFRFEDFTFEQLNEIRGEDGVTPVKGVDYFDGENGVNGLNGNDGLSAYDYAIKGGYEGTVNQFSEEQASIVNHSARLSAVEKEKADLGKDGYVLPEQINPLQGKQTGVELEKLNRYSLRMPNEMTTYLATKSFSFECCFDWDFSAVVSPTTMCGMLQIRDNYNRDLVAVSRLANGTITNLVESRRVDGTYEQNFLANVSTAKTIKRKYIHIVISVNREEGIAKAYLNGKFYFEKLFFQSVSNISSLDFIIGNSLNVNAKPFTARHCRLFNYELSQVDVNGLYNNSYTSDYRINYEMNAISENKCIMEFTPEGLAGNQWINTIDKNLSLSLIGNGSPRYEVKGYPITPLFVARGAVYNELTGFYELNGLTDITEEQMYVIFSETANLDGRVSCMNLMYMNKCRTNFIPCNGAFTIRIAGSYDDVAVSAVQMARACSNIEVLNVGDLLKVKDVKYFAYMASKLREIIGIIDIGDIKSSGSVSKFAANTSLTTFNLRGLQVSISLETLSELDRNSILYMGTNRLEITPITITLHPAATERLMPEDIAYFSSVNITIA